MVAVKPICLKLLPLLLQLANQSAIIGMTICWLYGHKLVRVEASYAKDNGNELGVQLGWDGSRKSLKLDGVLSRQLSSLLSLVKVIYSAPEDIQLVMARPFASAVF
jgi:hypothetical protein